MKLYSQNENYKLYNGDMNDLNSVIENNSIDAVVTDPPYELGFMGKSWDASGIAFRPETWRHCWDVLKPGGYLLAFGGSRTFHRIACAIEDAGFEIRDTIMYLYGSGFPKSMNIGKAVESKVLNGSANKKDFKNLDGIKVESGNWGWNKSSFEHGFRPNDYAADGHLRVDKVNYQTKEGKMWDGWGTALKPSFEPIIVARKPCDGTCVDNVLKWGVGGINIDECRVGENGGTKKLDTSGLGESKNCYGDGLYGSYGVPIDAGRFPANTILTYDDSDFDEVCGGFPYTKSTGGSCEASITGGLSGKVYMGGWNHNTRASHLGGLGDEGSASRYFMNCKFNERDNELWKNIFANSAEKLLEIGDIKNESIAQMNVDSMLKELKDHYAKYVESQQDLCETLTAQDIVEILTWDSKIETSRVIQDFITNSKKCIQFQNLVQFVEQMDNIDTTQTTQNLLKLFGYVRAVITNYILGNLKCEQKRYIYSPKASKRDRDEGLDGFETKQCVGGGGGIGDYLDDVNSCSGKFDSEKAPHKNNHPCVKPTSLMQYLIRLVSPKGATILDPFMGSGSTGKAAMYENKDRNADYKFIGIELTDEYLPIAKARIDYVINNGVALDRGEDETTNEVSGEPKPKFERFTWDLE